MNKLIHGDCLEELPKIPDKSVNLVFADPPYFLSNDGISYNSGKVVSVNKGEWDKYTSKDEIYEFTRAWISQCKRILKDDGSIFISGTHHNIFDIGVILRELGFTIINFITWNKQDPPPLIYKNKFRFAAEHIIWARPYKKHLFNYDVVNYTVENELTDVWKLPSVSLNEKKYGKHPTMKPEILLRRIILSTTSISDIVLDPFLGSGTTCVVAKALNRLYIGIEKKGDFIEIAKKRLENI